MKKHLSLIKKYRNFFITDIWRIKVNELPKAKAFIIKQIRIILLAVRGFDEDKCTLKASALTFYSLLSVVPVAAMGFGIAEMFGLEKKLENVLLDRFAGQEEVFNYVFNFAKKFLESTKGGLIAGIGAFILIWTVMKVLGNIENSFNDIWQIKKPRPFLRKFTDYLSLMLVGPIILVLSSSVTVFITTQIQEITEEIHLLGYISPIIYFLIKLIPYVLIWLLLMLIYIVMPNTKVNFKSALIAGIIAGTAFQLIQWVYIHFQVGVSRYNAIYGSFAALPLFLVWLQTSWWVVLFGAEISFANQNVERYEFEIDAENISLSFRKRIHLIIAHLLVKNFMNSEKAFTAHEISEKLDIPVRMVRDSIYDLQESGIVSQLVTDKPKVHAYQPAIDINKLSVNFIVQAIENKGLHSLTLSGSDNFNKINHILDKFNQLIEESNNNILLKDL